MADFLNLIKDFDLQMNKLYVNLKNCYGIKSLEHTFEFTNNETVNVVYASNGLMKSSFAKTFKDISTTNNGPKELVFGRTSSYAITIDDDKDLPRENIFVIRPYEEDYKITELEFLLIPQDKKQEYNKLMKDIKSKRDTIFKELKKKSGVKEDEIEKLVKSIFVSRDDFIRILQDVLNRNNAPNLDYSQYKYNSVFHAKITDEFDNDSTLGKKYIEYLDRYNQLVDNSGILKRGFDHNNVDNIIENLKKNGWAEVKRRQEKGEIKGHIEIIFKVFIDGRIEEISETALKDRIEEEKTKILSDETLKNTFNAINALSNSNPQFREFTDIIRKEPRIIECLKKEDRQLFQKDFWISYFLSIQTSINELLSQYQENEDHINGIKRFASSEDNVNKWKEVLSDFHNRFHVPVKIDIGDAKKIENIAFGEEKFQEFVFKFQDDDGNIPPKDIKKEDLLQVLSQGERRALYLLHIMFDLKVREEQGKKTLLIIDDIADSFDYQNKYAIINYLVDLSKKQNFHQIVFTHNYDFYRSLIKKLSQKHNNTLSKSYECLKSTNKIELVKPVSNNPFKDWKNNCSQPKYLIALIPFARNLVEYFKKTKEKECKDLTMFLHIKDNDNGQTTNKTIADIINSVCSVITELNIQAPLKDVDVNQNALEFIQNTADAIYKRTQDYDLASKVVLSIAIRLEMEKFCIDTIKKHDSNFCLRNEDIKSDQTEYLMDKCLLSSHLQNIVKLFNKVRLMIPENIHLNSFMYEPIIDMDILDLKELYQNCKTLNNPQLQNSIKGDGTA